jgi:hypothetical protein
MHAEDFGGREPSDMMSKPPFPDIDELVQRLLDDQIQPDEMKRLQETMLKDPRVQDYYIDSIFTCTVMRRCSQEAAEWSESDLAQVLSGGGRQRNAKHGGRHLYLIAAALMLGAIIFASLSLFRHRDPGPAIGTLADAYEAQWRGSHPRPGELLYAGAYDLREGVAKMDLGHGASLLLEAPCQVELKSTNEVSLREGTLTSLVPSQARGFRVRTPTALITDLGTEFGVIAHSDGSTEAHVLKGHINIALDPNRSGRSTSLVVNENRAAVVDATGRTIQGGLAARADFFLLQLPPHSQPPGPPGRVNLADIVGGGNGRGTGALDQGIDLGTGQAFRYPATAIGQSQRNEYRPSPEFRGIDGVFVPNGALGPVVVSSTGLTFAECPRTLGSYFGGPVNSGKFSDFPGQQVYAARLDGVSFGTSAHPALTLHPNAGITFDLDQIRQDNADIQIDRFTAVCSIPKNLPHSSADVWILLDGVLRLHLRYPADRQVVEKVEVPIPTEARFLTLAATCTRRTQYSWILFGDPFLEPAATK